MNDTQEFEAAQVAAQAEAEANIEFASGDEALHYLAEKLSNIEDAKEQAKVSRAFAAYDAKVEKLLEFNEQLIAENSVMAEAIQEFSSKTGAVVQFSPGSDGGYEHHLSVPEVGRGATTDFERRCAQLEASGKSPTDAIRFAIVFTRVIELILHRQRLGRSNRRSRHFRV